VSLFTCGWQEARGQLTGLNNEALTRDRGIVGLCCIQKRGVHCGQVRWIQGRPTRAATPRNCVRSKPQASEAASSVPERVKCSRAPSEWHLWAPAAVFMYGVLDLQQMMPMQYSSCGKACSHVDTVIAAARKGLCKGLWASFSQSGPADPGGPMQPNMPVIRLCMKLLPRHFSGRFRGSTGPRGDFLGAHWRGPTLEHHAIASRQHSVNASCPYTSAS